MMGAMFDPSIGVLDLCCGGKRCPKFTPNPDGSVTITDPDQADGAIVLAPEHVARVAAWFAAASDRPRAAQTDLHDAIA